ncbi:MAG TPA: DMT family transporter [Acidimicrobiia bacterium]|nr:DMT family transporter [Acidimicrobiia bacterium]
MALGSADVAAAVLRLAGGDGPVPWLFRNEVVAAGSGRAAAAFVLALAAAFMFALSNVLEQREAEQVPDDESLRLGLITRLVRRPMWLAGFGADAGGYVFHAAALGFGSLVFVQPLLVTGLLFALLLRAMITGRPLQRRELLAALVLAGGLVVFLLVVSPHGGKAQAPIGRWAIAGPVIAAAIALCVVTGQRVTGSRRALLLGLAAGISFGVSAALTKTFVHLLGQGVFPMLQHWEPYALAVATLGGLLLAQSSFQAGSLSASIAALEVAEPVVAAAIGVGILDERVRTGSVMYQVAIVLALIGMFFGVVALSRSSEFYEETGGPLGQPGLANPGPSSRGSV